MTVRSSGILLHPTSLPGKYGIGSLGEEARKFVDWLSESGQKIWQILPLGPTDFSYSPYQCYSAFAGNSDLIDLDELVEMDLLHPEQMLPAKAFPLESIDYHSVRKFREIHLHKAFLRFREIGGFGWDNYLQFWSENSWWLESWSLFYACRKNLKGKDWSYWAESLVSRTEEALNLYYRTYREDVEFQRFLQFLFFKQWFSLKKYANNSGIKIFGDIPLYVSYDSVDVWTNQDIFLLDKKRKPVKVGGVPPDYFSETGQLWGNPLFDWEKLKQRDYDWWIARLHFNLQMYDLVRIDHFRGLESYWAIPYGEKTAVKGEWLEAHGDAVLKILQKQIDYLPIIAEDLGTITKEIHLLRKKYALPGMKVLQFAFASDAENEHLPHNYELDFVAYTGTHDNDTTVNWLKTVKGEERDHLQRYFGTTEIDHWKMIRAILGSVVQMTIIPMQDLLGLGSSARMNTPGTIVNNWKWKLASSEILKEHGEKLKELTALYGR
ncbi:MAG: 4-alpha-glucanotransferase [Bacteroidia bacterium]|nr:4-alpha-glucanotransferase [Bacteroidia bacterium]